MIAILGLAAVALTADRAALLVAPHALRGPSRSAASSIVMEDEVFKCDVRKLPKSAIALDITVPSKVSNEIHLKTLAKLAKNARVPGFRDGKVPPQAVIAKLGMLKVKEATVEQIVDVGMQQSGVGQKIQTVGEARLPEELEVLAERYKPGESISFTVEVDVYPQVPIDDSVYKGLEVDVERVDFNQDAYDNALLKLRNQHADLVPVGAGVPAEEGMQVLVDMNGFLANEDGTPGEALPAVAGGEDVQVPLAPGKFMPGLVEGIVGACDGETRDITVTFPPRSSVPQLAGKTAIFKVLCKTVQRRELPEVPSEEFADKVKNGMSWAELDEKLREGVMQDSEEKLKLNTHKALTTALTNVLPDEFEVPETMIEDATKERFAAMLADMREQGTTDEKLKEIITAENYERYKKISRPMTSNGIKGEFALKTVATQQSLLVPDDQVDDEVMTLQAQSLQRGEKFKESEVRRPINDPKDPREIPSTPEGSQAPQRDPKHPRGIPSTPERSQAPQRAVHRLQAYVRLLTHLPTLPPGAPQGESDAREDDGAQLARDARQGHHRRPQGV